MLFSPCWRLRWAVFTVSGPDGQAPTAGIIANFSRLASPAAVEGAFLEGPERVEQRLQHPQRSPNIGAGAVNLQLCRRRRRGEGPADADEGAVPLVHL